jgi:hypothetical protein
MMRDERNGLENLAGGYRFGRQTNEYDVPNITDITTELKFERFVYDLKTVFRQSALNDS